MDRLIKRYQNRKLYDTGEKQYVKLSDIEEMIRNNVDLKIIDNVTGEDITRQILIQIIMRMDPKAGTESRMPLDGLRDMIQNRDSAFFQAFRGVLDFGREVVQQIVPGSRLEPDGASGGGGSQWTAWMEMARHMTDSVTEKAVQLVNGSVTREMLQVPTRDDWRRIERKLDELERRLAGKAADGGLHDESGKSEE